MVPDPNALPRLDGSLRKLARRLVVDAACADDLVQDAWLAALRRGDGSVVSWAAWLSATVRSLTGRARRTDDRRSRREIAAARPEPVESAAALAERECLRRQLMDALLALPEMYRIALALRFLDDLPPRKVAAKLGIPTETARTRIKRGLDLMRERLDDEDGDRRAGGVALAPLAVPKSTALALAWKTAGEVLLMNVATKVSLVTLALCGIVWVVGSFDETAPVESSTRSSGTVEASIESTRSPDSAAPLDTPADAERHATEPAPSEPAPTVAAATTGSIEIEVRYASDGAPGAGVGFEVRGVGFPTFDDGPRAVADEHGIARVHGLPPGYVGLFFDRGALTSVEVVAGQTTHKRVDLAPGALIEGVVLSPSRVPVANASIYLSIDTNENDAERGFIVARTDEHGAFSIRDVASYHDIGARAKGFAPSPLRAIEGHAGARVFWEFVLRDEAATFRGRVVDSSGHAVANASLRLEETGPSGVPATHEFDDGGTGRSAVALRATTSASGDFAFEGVSGEPHVLLARAKGFALHHEQVTPVRDAPPTIVVMQPTPILRGRVTDANGVPIQYARIEVASAATTVSTTSDAMGEYTMDVLPIGTFDATAMGSRGTRASTRVTLAAGVTSRADFVLTSGRSLRGRIVDERGYPRTGFLCQATPTDGDSDESLHSKVSNDGAFAFEGCDDVTYRVDVVSFAPTRALVKSVDGARPGSDELVLVVTDDALPTAKFTLCVVDGDGKPVCGADVRVHTSALSVSTRPTDATTGCCSIDGLPPNTYGVSIEASGFATVRLPDRTLGPHESIDLGTIQLGPPGSFEVAIDGLPPEASDSLQPLLVHGDGTHYGGARIERDGDRVFVRHANLRTGRFTLTLDVEGYSIAPVSLEIRANDEARATVRAAPVR